MLKSKTSLVSLAAAVTLAALACTLAVPAGTDVSASALTQVAATIEAGLTGTAEAQPENLTATLPPEGGGEAAVTTTPAATSTAELPLMTVSVDTNCREGPGFKYLYKGALHVGEVGTVVGKSSEAEDYVVIKHPTRADEQCWVWLEYAAVSGSLEGLPEVNVPIVPRLSAIGGILWGDTCLEGNPGNPPPGCVDDGPEFDGNGVIDAGETGIGSGYVIRLGEGACTSSGFDSDTTDADGRYFFSNLEAGTYCVSIVANDAGHPFTLNGRWTFPTRGTGTVYAEVGVEAGEHKTNIDFGFDWCPLC